MLLPGIVPILHVSLLNHMTIVTKVGMSYIDHTNDDVPEVESFSSGCFQALSSPRFWGESQGRGQGTLTRAPARRAWASPMEVILKPAWQIISSTSRDEAKCRSTCQWSCHLYYCRLWLGGFSHIWCHFSRIFSINGSICSNIEWSYLNLGTLVKF